MKRARFCEEQIIGVLKKAEAEKVREPRRRHGISDASFHTRRRKYGGPEVSHQSQAASLARSTDKQ